MNLASALIKQVLVVQDYDTWMNVRKHYLPNEYHQLFDIVTKHSDRFHKLPTLEELKLEVRDAATLDKVYALESIEVETEPFLLLDYVKNEYAQKEALFQLDKWVDGTISFETAEEVVRHLQQIAIDLEEKVELTPAEESMQRIELFESDEDMAKRVTLGMNSEFDANHDFRSIDYILIGGKRGSGKSIVSSNVAHRTVENNKRALFFSIEMDAREVLQRQCAIAAKVPFFKIRNKNLNNIEWERVVDWWASRYQDSEAHVKSYLEHRDFGKFHTSIARNPLVDAYVDIVYDPGLTLGRIKAETEKRARDGNLGVIIVDYINQVKRIAGFSSNGQYDWKEQIEISKALKHLAQEYQVPVLSPYQIDASGEARFAKGILDSCDAAFTLDSHTHEDACITFQCTKMRAMDDESTFTSAIDWNTLTIGPASAVPPVKETKGGFGKPKKQEVNPEVYDDQSVKELPF